MIEPGEQDRGSVESAACGADTNEWGRSPGFRGNRYSDWGQPHDTVVNRRMQNEWCKQPMRTSETTPWVEARLFHGQDLMGQGPEQRDREPDVGLHRVLEWSIGGGG